MKKTFFNFLHTSILIILCTTVIGTAGWEQATKVVADSRIAAASLGYSVSISGNFAVVGATGENSYAGAAYIFKTEDQGTTWTQVQRIAPADITNGDYFGSLVSISGNNIVVGAPNQDDGGNSNVGAAYAYTSADNGVTWTLSQKLLPDTRTALNVFGRTVSISGNNILVGEHLANAGHNSNGIVYAFHTADGGSNWTKQTLQASDAASQIYFGISLSISDSLAIVGAYKMNSGTAPGAAYIFKTTDDGLNWTEKEILLPADGAANDQFGYSVAISGNLAIVGAQYEDEDADGLNYMASSGSAYIYKSSDGGENWAQKEKLVASDRTSYDYYGYTVSITDNHAVVGVSQEKHDENGLNEMTQAGSAYIYSTSDNGESWSQMNKIVASDRKAGDQFGISVAVTDTMILIGAFYEDEDAAGANTLEKSGSFYVYKPGNETPTVTVPIEDVTVDEDATDLAHVDLNSIFTDVEDGTVLTFAAVSDTPGLVTVAIGASDSVLTLSFVANASGSADITVTATDAAGDAVIDIFTVTVDAVNDAPTLSVASTQTVIEDTSIELLVSMVTASDIENDALTLTVSAGTNYTVTGTTITPEVNFNGTLSVPVSVSDASKVSNELTMTVTVTPDNDAPTLSIASTQTIDEDSSIELLFSMVTAADHDNDPLTLNVLPGTNYSVTGTTISPDVDFNGTLNVPVSVSDASENSNEIVMTVIVTPINDAPILTSVTDQTVEEDGSILIDISMVQASDIEGDTITVIVDTGDNYTVSNNTIVPVLNYNGTLLVPIRANAAGDTTVPVIMNIEVTPVNDLPAITSDLSMIIDEGEACIYTSTAEDIDDGDTLSFTYQNLPTWLTVVYETVSGVPPEGASDTSFTIIATDSQGGISEAVVSVHIIPVNSPPVLVTAIPDTVLNEDFGEFPLILTHYFQDPDFDSLKFAVINTEGASLNIEGDTLTLASDDNWNGIEVVVITAKDPAGLSVSDTFSVTVEAVNDTPVMITKAMPAHTDEDVSITLTIDMTDAYDPDGDSLTLLLEDGDFYSVIDNATLVPDPDYFGAIKARVKVTDGTDTSLVELMNISVSAVNDKPVLVGPKGEKVSASPGKKTVITLDLFEFENVDNDTLYILVEEGEEYTLAVEPLEQQPALYRLAINGLTEQVVVYPNEGFSGELLVPVRLTNGVDTTEQTLLPVQVEAVTSNIFDNVLKNDFELHSNYRRFTIYNAQPFNVDLYTVTGQRILRVSGAQEGTYILNTPFKTGIYILKFSNAHGTGVIQFCNP